MSEEHIHKMLAQKAIREGMMAHQQEGSSNGGGNGILFAGGPTAPMGGLSSMCGRIEAFLAEAKNAPAPQCLETTGEEGDSKKAAGGKRRGGAANANSTNSLPPQDDREIQLNLILGVFEERKAAMAAAAANGDAKAAALLGNSSKASSTAGKPSSGNVFLGGEASGASNILLPSKAAEDLLYAEKLRDSHAVLSMFSALADTRGEAGHSDGKKKRKGARQLGVKGGRGRTRDDDDDACDDETAMRCAEAGEEDDDDDNVDAASSSSSEVVIMDAEDLMTSSDDEEDDPTAKAKALLFGGGRRPLIEEM